MRWVGCQAHFTDGNTEAQRVWGLPMVSWYIYGEAFFSPSFRNSLMRFPKLVPSHEPLSGTSDWHRSFLLCFEELNLSSGEGPEITELTPLSG